MHGVKIHNGRSWWRLSHVWRKCARCFTWLSFQKMHFCPGRKTVLVITPNSSFRRRVKMNLPSYFAAFLCVSVSLPSLDAALYIMSCHVLCRGYRVLFGMRDICRVSSRFNTENWVKNCMKLFGSLTGNYYCVYPCHRLPVWTVSSTTSQLLEYWHKWPFRSSWAVVSPHLESSNSIQECWGALKMTLFFLYVPLALFFSLVALSKQMRHFTFVPCVIRDVKVPKCHFGIYRNLFIPQQAFKSLQPVKDAFTKASASLEHWVNVESCSFFPTLFDTRTPSFNTC